MFICNFLEFICNFSLAWNQLFVSTFSTLLNWESDNILTPLKLLIIILAASQAYILSGTDLIYQSSVWNDKVIHEGILRTQRASCEKAKYICFHAYWCPCRKFVLPVATHEHTLSKGWKLKENGKTNIWDIRIHFYMYPICFHLARPMRERASKSRLGWRVHRARDRSGRGAAPCTFNT
jgi:hypothetical protein